MWSDGAASKEESMNEKRPPQTLGGWSTGSTYSISDAQLKLYAQMADFQGL